MLLENQQMFLSITNFQEPGVSRREPGRQPQERGSEPRSEPRLPLQASRTKPSGSRNAGAYLATCHGRFCHPGRVPGAPSDAAAALTRGLGREVA